MRNFKLAIFAIITTLFIVQNCFAQEVWINDSRRRFVENSLQIYEINLRNFNATDTNNNGIIDFDDGEESGNFLNAIQRLDELAESRINTIQLMPIMEVGKTKALGTAGSLYAPLSFNRLNPQLSSPKTALSVEDQAIKFINEAHRRRIRVIVEVPAFGSYDLYQRRPELFLKGNGTQGLSPAEYSDVRVFNTGSDGALNREVLNLYRSYVDYVMSLGVDGISANSANTKPAKFWEELINYSRKKDPQFLWIAQSGTGSNISQSAALTSNDKLLSAGFDGVGILADYRNIKSSRDFMNVVKSALAMKTKSPEGKAYFTNFVNHDTVSPILDGNAYYLDGVFWLNAILPANSFMTDGLPSGDAFVYFWGNKKAPKTYTDNSTYFVHRGKMDIFNFSRKPGGNNIGLKEDYNNSNNFKYNAANIYLASDFNFEELHTTSSDVFAFAISGGRYKIIAFGNVKKDMINDVKISVQGLKEGFLPVPVKVHSIPKIENGKISTSLLPYEIMILAIEK